MEKTVAIDPIVLEAERRVIRLLSEQLTTHHWYHDLEHTLQVRRVALELGERMELAQDELEVLELAALFHDTGFTEVYDGHEAASHRIAREFLEARDYPQGKLDKVLACIEATQPSMQPRNLLEEIICDADLSNLAQSDYLRRAEDLRHEWRIFRNEIYTKTDWHKLNHDFLEAHEYRTEAARELFAESKADNLEQLKTLVKKEKKKKKKNKEKGIQGSRSAQMMFKTALRNHIDLSALADNKANIMLTINAAIVTFVLPLGLSYAMQYNFLFYPLASLLITCLVAIVYATLATRPAKMSGKVPESRMQAGTANLFFFGNFYEMTFDEYKHGIDVIVNDDNIMEAAIMRDLHSLGTILGRKYRLLRICYTVFMVGVVVSVLVFFFAFYGLPTTS